MGRCCERLGLLCRPPWRPADGGPSHRYLPDGGSKCRVVQHDRKDLGSKLPAAELQQQVGEATH